MSVSSKSSRKVLRVAPATAEKSLPLYAHRFSPRKFTQHQLFACLVLKNFFKVDYRGIVAILRDAPEICSTMGLLNVPHFTTLQKASRRLLRAPRVERLLDHTVRMAMGRRQISTSLDEHCSRPTTKLPNGRYRRLMKQRFDIESYGQRWQSETVFSMIKRNRGSVLRPRSYWAQCRELSLIVRTHNIMIILSRTGFLQSRSGAFSASIRSRTFPRTAQEQWHTGAHGVSTWLAWYASCLQ